MPLLNRKDIEFCLYHWLEVQNLCQLPQYEAHSAETFNAALDTAEQIAERYFEPHNRQADENEPWFDGEKVHTIPEVKTAYHHFVEAGLLTARHGFDHGGMQLPATVASACMAYITAANPSSAAYPFLTMAAMNLIEHFAGASLQADFLPLMRSGRATGTMALTEPAVGSSLGDITTHAVEQSDGHFHIRGQKMFISGGDHELTENIVHLVLARIKGAPAGVKGISLFLVPKWLVDSSGKPIKRNDVQLAGLLHKMGYRGTSSTVLNFGEQNECVGYLIGEPHHGLKYMFMMMNEARIGVGMGAAVMGCRGYLESLSYARERPQGRLPGTRDSLSAPVNIIEHADVKRMLLAQKAYSEGAFALCMYANKLVDELVFAGDAERASVSALLDLLTPVVKAWPSEYGPKANDLAIQVLGGSGYTREYPVEQLYRDNRLNPIHEGTNGIQAIDLLGRKLWQAQSAGLLELLKRVQQTIHLAQSKTELSSHAEDLARAVKRLSAVTQFLGGQLTTVGPNKTLANASAYFDLFSTIVLGWVWLSQAYSSVVTMADLEPDGKQFYLGKLQACQYFYKWELPKVEVQAALLESMDDTCDNMKTEWF